MIDDILDWLSAWWGLVVISLLMVAFVWWVIDGSISSEQQKCVYYDGTTIEHEWQFWSGCRVQMPNGYWVDVDDAYMFFTDTRGE